MDRALNSEALADALGQHAEGALPSVEELINLIADLEVQTFIRPEAVDEDLLRAAWYLHGIASASAAQELYTPARQQRAFAVSAHIFDLALNETGRDVRDRLTLAFGAQVGYRRSDLDPNATAIWRRVDDLLDGLGSGPERDHDSGGSGDPGGDMRAASISAESFMTMALRAGVAFLGLDVARIGQLLRVWRTEAAAMASRVEMDSLQSTMFGPAEAVTRAVAELMAFLRYGSRERLRAARTWLLSVIDRRAGDGDHDARWVAAHLLAIADGMETSSIWSVLPDGTPDKVAQAFTVGAPPVLTLWPPQRDLLMRTTANPLDPDTTRLLLSVPTSAGKTLLAQVLICHHLATQPGDVCYVTPLRSLGREMRQALSVRLRVLQKGLGADLPDFGAISIDDFFTSTDESGDSSVEVMTPERLAHLLRRDPEDVLDRFSMFVIDEAHLLAQRDRGFLLEWLLAVLATTDARLILLSGVMGNADKVAAWLDPTRPDVLFSSDWRGPRRLHALLYSHVVWEGEERLPLKSKTFTSRASYPMIADLRVRPAESNVHRLTTPRDEPIGEMERKRRANGSHEQSTTPFYLLCARTAHVLLPTGSLLMILSRRDYARNAAQEVAKRLDVTSRTEALREFLEERLGEQHPLVDCVVHGVAYHHAGLPVDVLDALEQAMRSEVLLAMFATSTLTDGVNLPVRTVLICETRYQGQDPGQQMDGPRLLNAVGRAGRAGRETEGWIVLGVQAKPADRHFEVLQPAADDLEIVSTLHSNDALHQLAEAEALIAETADALFELASGAAANFATFVWFVLSTLERLDPWASATDPRDVVRRLLAFTQMPGHIEQRWMAFANHVEQQYARTPPESRRRWTVTGTALRSAQRIEQIAVKVANEVAVRHEDLPQSDSGMTSLTTEEALAAFDDAGIFELLLELPEAGKVWRFKPTVGAKTTVDVSVASALRGWLAGMDMPALAAAILPTVDNPSWRLEQTVDAVSGAFEHFLSWTVGVVVSQANELLVERGSATVLPEDLSYFIRYGVDTTTALKLLTSGVKSRRIAHQIGRKAQAQGIEWREVRDWLRNLHIAGWRHDFEATSREIEDLAEFCRSPARNPLRQLLEDHETTVDLARPLDFLPTSPRAVELRMPGPSDPVEVWTVDSPASLIGIIAVASHADIQLLHNSGVEYSATTDGIVVRLREAD